jgi:YfiH family protein
VSAPDEGRRVTDASFAPPARSGADTSATAPDEGRRETDAAVAPPARGRAALSTTAAAARTDDRPPGAPVARLAPEVALADRMVPRAELAEWRERFGLVAGLTERGANGGFSLGLQTEEPVGQVMGRWRAFLHAVHRQFSAFQMARQVHSATVAWHEQVGAGWHVAEEIDGHATRQRGLLLGVTIADCVPIYLAARDGEAVALLHAGWRGVAAGILERGVGLLASRSGGGAADVVVHLGVGICGACYEVGPEVVRAVEGRVVRGATQLDLRDALAARAARLGVREITRSPHCTACSRDRFFSHRGSAGRDGRMVAYLGRPLDGAPGLV